MYDKDGNMYEPNGEGQYVICFADKIEAGEFTPQGTDWKYVVEEDEIPSFLHS